MKRLLPIALLGSWIVVIALLAPSAHAQLATADDVTESDFRIYTSDGTPATLDDIRQALGGADVVFVGELHNDPVSHYIEQRVLEAWFDAHGHAAALSLEMFARDVQYIVDEYLAGHITDNHFQQSSSPWSNYETDYRPLVEFARENGLAVVAANAPRRYANMVSRGGRSALEGLSDQALSYLAPLPFSAASDAYEEQWNQVMAEAMQAMREAAQEEESASHEHGSDSGHEGMDHGGMDHGDGHSMGGMDHGDGGHSCPMKEEGGECKMMDGEMKMGGMDHGEGGHEGMDHGDGHSMEGMQHGEGHDMGKKGHSCPMKEEGGECKMMDGEMKMGGMDHGKMDHGDGGHEGMDHGDMDHGDSGHEGMDHGDAGHEGMDHGDMDHSQMDHSDADHDAGHDSEAHQAPAAQPQHGGGSMLDAQSLWDATMAWSIAEHMTRTPGAKVAHFVGGFHVESGTGTPEHLIQYRPGTRMLIISVQSVDDPTAFDAEEHTGLGDFVVLGDASLPRTYETRTR